MVSVIAVDDEWYNLEEICDLVDKTGFMRIAGKYQNPLKALEEAGEKSPEVAFIDIEMPEIDGITLAEKLLEIHPSIIIIFITSWDKYAVQAFDLNALDYIMKPIKTERFSKMADKIQNELRLRVPSSSGRLRIKCFNRFETSIGGNPVKWQRAKAEELFAFLLMNHGSQVHKEEIIENLWSEYEPVKALPILQTSICKIRNVFSGFKEEVKILYSGSKYCLTLVNAQCDYLEVREALENYRNRDGATYSAVEKAWELYGNGFMAQQGYLWSMEKDEELRRKLVMYMKEIISVYLNEGKIKKSILLLSQLTRLVPYEEEVNYMFLKALGTAGDIKGALEHYGWLEGTLREEYGSLPSEKIRKFAAGLK